MFWGFVLEPKKRYNTTVTKPFHISMAAIDLKTASDNEYSSLVLNVDGTETILCNLGKPNYLQERLDLNFVEGNTITLEVKGKATVHLSGYFIYEQDGMDDESDLDDEEDLEDEDEEVNPGSTAKALKALKNQMKNQKKSKFNTSTTEEEDSDDDDDSDDDESMDVSDLTFDEDDDDDDEDDDDDGEDDDDEEDDDEEEEEETGEVKVASPGSTPMPPKKKFKSANNTPVSASKKIKIEPNESGKKNKGDKQSPQKQQQAALTNGNTTPGSNKKKKNKEANGVTPNSTPNKQQQQSGGDKTPKKSLEGGVIVEDIKVGAGVPAKPGKMTTVYYVGKLKSNNKQFDSTTQGAGFKFRLGKGEVIKGWDVGVSGMRVGGKRRITVPAHMAYGNKGSPPAIPPNSTLVFDVELKNVS